ncbi:reticulon 2b [Pimephales promelas]|nr:reticulon 2b [Pimephales promelas]
MAKKSPEGSWRSGRRGGLVWKQQKWPAKLSAITVLSNLGLGIMAFTLPVRFLYKASTLVRLSDGSHPFQSYLDEDHTLTDEDTVRMAEQIVLLIATAVTEIKRLFFIDSIMDSVKFVVFLYLLTYVGVQANGLTLVMTGKDILLKFVM